MKALYRLATSTAVVVTIASPSLAGQVRLEIRNGLVTLDAKDASVREVLAEWARVGQTRIVNGERAPGSLLTLQLTDVPEKKALDIVLRASAGYIAAPRVAAAEAGSQYDRIVVMAVPRPAAGPAGSPAIPAPPSGDRGMGMGARGMPDRNFYPPQPGVMVDDQDQPVEQPQQPMQPTPGTAAQPGMPTATPQQPYQPGGMPPQGGTPPAGVMPQPQGGMVSPPGAQQPGVPVGQPTRPGVPTTPVKPPGNPEGGPGGQ